MLPTAKDTGLSEHQEANRVVEKVLKDTEASPAKKKRKYTTTSSPGDRADIGRYAAKNGNAVSTTSKRAQCAFLRRNTSPS
jgi:hypothetical protein